MKKYASLMILLCGMWLTSFGCLGPAIVTADEPAEDFLEALREAQYFDIAVDYLSKLESGNLASDEFRKLIPFEKAATIVAMAKSMKDFTAAEKKFDEAQIILNEFNVQGLPFETQARVARAQGDLYYWRARINQFQSSSDRLTAAERESFGQKSRTMLQGAMDSYKVAREKIRGLIDPASPDGIKIDPQDPSTGAKLKRFQGIYIQIRRQFPLVIEQLAETYPTNSPAYAKFLSEAVKEYNDVYSDYPNSGAGLDARIFAARCQQKMGQHKQALITLEDIFNQADNSALRRLKRNAFLMACDSWAQVQPYPANEIIYRLEPAVTVLNRDDIRDPDWLRIQLELAKAKHARAGELAAAGNPKSESDALERDAGRLLRSIARIPSPHRDQALQFISEWNVSMAVEPEIVKTPETFVDARQQAKDLVQDLEPLLGDSLRLSNAIASAADDQKPNLQTELAAVSTDINAKTTTALELLELALRLRDDTTDRADVNNVRYLQSFCYFARQQYFESAIIGEFLLNKYPNVDGTRGAASLVVQSYLQLLRLANEADKQYELNKLNNVCTNIAERWPGSKEAGLAASTMVKLALDEKNFPQAQTYFGQIPENYSVRGSLASTLGQQLWFEYRRQLPGTKDQQESLRQMMLQSKDYLEIGAKSATLEDLDFSTALGCLLLVDAHLEAGEVEQAVQRLENSAIAPLDLVKQKHPAITGSQHADVFNSKTYEIAVKTYLASIKNSPNPQPWIEKANGVIAAMRANMEATNDPRARAQVTSIYGLIATELLNQFAQLQSVEEKKKFAGSLQSFLGSIEKDSQDARTILWAGSTLLNVANSLNELGEGADAKPLFEQAVSALSRAESMGFSSEDPKSVVGLTRELQRQRALAQRGSGNFEAAIDQFVAILEKKEMDLNVQMDAMETLQAWGKSTGSSLYYQQAMMGTRSVVDPKTKRKKNLIWGWQKMFTATRGNEKFVDAFYQSLYRLVECRLEWGLIEKNQKAIDNALLQIENAEKHDSALGGPVWKQKLEDLKARIKEHTK